MSAAIITGGAGFIGSNLADALLAQGREVHIVDNLVHGTRAKLPTDAVFHEMDIRDAAGMKALAHETAPKTIFHLAAQADVRKAIEEPGFDADVNVIGIINVLEAARAVGAKVIFASTGGAGYGEYEGLPIPTPETCATKPLSHYGQSKMCGEGYCGLYERLYGLHTVVLRLGNVYGPRQDPHGEAGVVSIFAGRMLDGIRPKVFGDGLQTRDYVYVGDVVRAFLAAEDTGPAGEVFNVGMGAEISVLDLLEGLGCDMDPEFHPARTGELARSALANDKAKELLGWSPIMPLDEGLQATYKAIAEQHRAPDSRPWGFMDV